MASPLKIAVNLLKNDSFEVMRGKISKRVRSWRERGRYQKWVKRYYGLVDTDVENIRRNIDGLETHPRISILMPVYNTDERYLRAAIDSVKAQIYENWELCIADDHSSDPHVRTILAEYAARDERIKIAIRAENGHIAAASNTALEMATGSFTALMDHDDELSPLAMYFVAREINSHADANIIYTDEDKIDENGLRFDPYFKPDWSPDLLLGVNYLNHLTIYRTTILRKCGAFRTGFDGSQDYDLLLRAVEISPASTVRHIPRPLYHWRATKGSVAYASDEKPYAHDRARNAIAEHLERCGVRASVMRGIGQLHKVDYELPYPPPKVSIIVHGGRSAVDVDRLLGMTGGSPVEILTSTNAGCTRRGERTTWVSPDHHNRYARLNLAASAATGSILCFLSSEIREAGHLWLETLIAHAMRPGVGAVGPMIFDTRRHITSAGYVLVAQKGVMSAFSGKPLRPRGRSLRLDVPQNVSAVPIDCLVVRAQTFALVGGFDEDSFDAFGAIDLCLRLRENGFRTVWDPRAELMRSAMPDAVERKGLSQLLQRWGSYFEHDPYHNPNLSLDVRAWDIAYPPRLEKY